MAGLRAAYVLTGFVLLTVLCVPLQWTALRLGMRQGRKIPLLYHRALCRLLGVKITLIGTPVKKGVLMVANHAGWLDIPIISTVQPLSFIAKSEISTWPLFGMLSRLQNTIFVHRAKRNAVVSDSEVMCKRLRAGDVLVVFPEGTSSDGNRVLRFKSALLGAAELPLSDDGAPDVVHVPVQPVSIAYVKLHGIPMGRENRPFFAWYGDMELVPHLWGVFGRGPIDVVIEFHQPLTVDQVGGRKQLAAAAEAIVRAGVARALSGTSATPSGEDEALAEALAEQAA